MKEKILQLKKEKNAVILAHYYAPAEAQEVADYVIRSSPLKDRVFKVFHTTEQTEDELKLIVDLGGTVADVFVWHKAYGKMEAKLNISSRAQIEQFIESVRTGKSVELMHITGGFHYHTVRANSEEILDRIGAALEKRNYIAPGN